MLGRLRFTSPDREDRPAAFDESGLVTGVAGFVAGNLRQPVALVAFDASRAIHAMRASVPKAAVDEHAGPARGKNKVRLAGQAAAMQPKAQSGAVEVAPDHEFWSRVPAPDPPHVLAAGRR